MSEYAESLWPDESTHPVLRHTHERITYRLKWNNTWIQRYRTGNEHYDKVLMRYDHVLHRLSGEEDEEIRYVIFPFEEFGVDNLRFLEESNYAQYVNPTPDRYTQEYIASKEAKEFKVPDTLEPEVGEAAA